MNIWLQVRTCEIIHRFVKALTPFDRLKHDVHMRQQCVKTALAQKTCCVVIKKTIQLMFRTEIIAVAYENHTKLTCTVITLCGKNS